MAATVERPTYLLLVSIRSLEPTVTKERCNQLNDAFKRSVEAAPFNYRCSFLQDDTIGIQWYVTNCLSILTQAKKGNRSRHWRKEDV